MKSITQVVQNLLKPYIDNKDKAYAGNIAPVEVSPAEAAHATGTQLIYNSVLYDVTAPIAIGDTLATSGVGANISVAYDISTQIKNHTVTTDAVPTKNSTNPVQSGGVYDADANIYAVMGRNGAKNLVPYPFSETTKSSNGIDLTDNGDGTVTVENSSGSSGATDAVTFAFRPRTGDNALSLPNGTYMLTGCPTGGSQNSYYILINHTENGSSTPIGYDTGDGLTFTVDNSTGKMGLFIGIKPGVSFSTAKTFNPMIRLASDTDDTYQPYAKTNQELTAEKTDIVVNATNGNFAGLNANGNLIDSGSKASDFLSSSYLESSTKTTADSKDTFTFTNAAITANASFDVYSDVFGAPIVDMELSGTQLSISFNSSDNVTTCRLYIR